MKKSTPWRMVLFIELLLWPCVHAYSGSLWGEFLRDPNENTLAALEKTFAACSSSDMPSREQEKIFCDLIRQGNPSVFRAALAGWQCLCFSAEYCEDVNESAGVFSGLRPQAFLRMVKEEAVPEAELKYLLLALPYDTVDDIDLQLSVVENRAAIMGSVDDPSVAELKEKALRFLEEERQTLEKIKKSEPAGVAYSISVIVENLGSTSPLFRFSKPAYAPPKGITSRVGLEKFVIVAKDVRGWDFGNPLWLLASPLGTRLEVEKVGYGTVPEGLTEIAVAKPLSAGVAYRALVFAGAGVGSVEFVLRGD